MSWEKLQNIFFIVFLILIIGSLFIYQIFGSNFDLGEIREYLKNFGIWAPFIFILIYIIGTIFIPSTPFMAIAGLLFGFGYGLFYTIIGGFLSSLLVFIISRKLGQKRVESILKNKYLKYINKYNGKLGKGAILDLVILRIIPIMPFNVLNILMGVSKIKTQDYLIGTLFGLIPSNVLAVYFGYLMTKIL
ncbi:MAG: hypothetical protein UR80_C0049G0003 [Parcubacteria group bacterium GW2011_GWB1_35_5]|uniref:TVP38/TMEM64 family membrane protein n=1 Tax=Candidatus Zambryskibacteria bacterium RIFCSPLOWO2_01_FULL_35_19 TaxID=1802757 RepID=A0A1G2TY97_9BACT|nr:MAG: hypothetical protein UR50_C0003G0079 [Parcubacteria group bacterium GW2011_GWC1_34_10]KKP79578.1 MAG: hypothetical protein UR80_C0049G0003 [Parcubacteria group bacterium GW2011_GWB1_35_5]OHA85868.1 MAG: hypothetical protein A2726_02360 [Candidatus Zambryskibacteria bacterium RIFCSPHIGHO2_01_FULL_35_32]OHB02285.1 MAG: hypothetical protein A3A90_00585 [Candidatus Zambryskibacteria bacterium RIFCSPLOWO2_01_FULL_35_19]